MKNNPSSGVKEACEPGRNSFKNERTLDLGVNSQPQSFSLLISTLRLFCSNLLLQMCSITKRPLKPFNAGGPSDCERHQGQESQDLLPASWVQLVPELRILKILKTYVMSSF